MLDTAHLGDIEGAFGRIRMDDTDHGRTLKTRLLTLLAIVGPGLIVMVGDNDAGGVATYAQAGQNYGYSLLWVLLLLDSGADRQPGDGGPPRCGHRSRPCPVDQRTLRPRLGLVFASATCSC